MKKILFVILALLAMNLSSAWAWGTTGHRVVAEIAERNLTRKAKKNLKKIIGDQRLAYWSNWPDFIKSDPTWKHADAWHYVNVGPALNPTDFAKEMDETTPDNLYKKTLLLIEELQDKNLPLAKKQENLYFLIHLIGDAHQPLHVGRAEDLGGNRIGVEWFGKKTNLHTLWDSKLVDFTQYSYTEFSTVLNIHDKKFNAQLTQGELVSWLYESYSTAQRIYDSAQPDAKLSYKYYFDYQRDLEAQLLKGGLRLAKILNDIYG
ncbi:S1/P1 nuclease [Flavobacterium sp. JP2137]|uniref:S1/P1 nuclease n=1 Tax=Flavobacterium sp. JP2137 TaxID=3414510 RepID=UPI003D300C4B